MNPKGNISDSRLFLWGMIGALSMIIYPPQKSLLLNINELYFYGTNMDTYNDR